MAPEPAAKTARRLELPTIVFGPVEIRRLQRELESLEEFVEQAAIRQPGKQAALPKTSRTLDAMAGNNNLNLLQAADRQKLKQFLESVSVKAPIIHMSFAADPSAAFTAKIVAWLRVNTHPYTLLQLGLQPSLAAGFIMRTENKTFDLSLRNRFLEQRGLLLGAINGVGSNVLASAISPAAPAAASGAAHE